MARAYPYADVANLSQFQLWSLIDRRQQQDTLAIASRAARHRYFARCLALNGYKVQPGECNALGDLMAAIGAYLCTVDDVEQLRDAGGLTQREVALLELSAFFVWVRQHRGGEPGGCQ